MMVLLIRIIRFDSRVARELITLITITIKPHADLITLFVVAITIAKPE